MGVITTILYTMIIIVSILLIGLILIQQSKGGGLGNAFGGAGEAVFGARAGTHLTKLTVALVTVFFVLVLGLAIIAGHKQSAKSVVETVGVEQPAAGSKAEPAAAKKPEEAPKPGEPKQ